MELASVSSLNPRFEADTGLLELCLDHGKANEVGRSELLAFEALCALVETSPEVVCVVTTSRRRTTKGRPVFVAGANVTERLDWDAERVMEHVDWQRSIMTRWRRLPVFTAAVSHGVTLGWGLEFCLANDMVLATAEATFGLPETGLGIVPGAGGTADLAGRVGVAAALRIGCTGEEIDAAEAARLGLVDRLVDDVDAGLSHMRSVTERLRRRSPTAVAVFKAGVLAGLGRPADERLEIERRAYVHMLQSGDAAIGRQAFDTIRSGGVPGWPPRKS